jgi:diketogulonate reductase-like aldo/keto reductase
MSLTLQSTHKLNDGNEIPALGFGVYQSEPGDETEQAVIMALEVNGNIDIRNSYSQVLTSHIEGWVPPH